MNVSNSAILAPSRARDLESICNNRSNSKSPQAELQRYKQLQDYEKEKKELRESLLERLENGAAVEPGALMLNVQEVQTRRVTQNSLKQLLGDQAATALIERMELSMQRRLILGQNNRCRSRLG